MRAVNWLFKVLGYIGIHITVAIECFLLSVCVTGVIDIVALSIYSVIKTIPDFIVRDLWKWFLLSCAPCTMLFFIIIVFDLLDLWREGRKLRKKGREALEEKEVKEKT